MNTVVTEQMLRGQVARLRAAQTDTQWCEVKACRGGLPKDLARTLSGFANGSGGLRLLGLDEEAGFRPVGGFDPKRIQDALTRLCDESLTPPVRPMIDIVLFEGAPVVVVQVEELRPKDKPCYITASGRYGGSYIRTGDGDRRLSSYEVDRLWDEHEQPHYDERIVEDAKQEDLDPDLVAGLLRRERRIHPRNFAQLSDEDALRRLRVLVRNELGEDRLSLAGLLALGSYPQEFFPRLVIAFASYPTPQKGIASADGRRFIDSCTCVGPIPHMVEDAMLAIERNMRTAARIEGAYRQDIPEYPHEALREALVNAVMHRDYSAEALGSAVQVDLYPDRLEVTNPGGLYGVVTLEALDAGGIGSCRNQRLASLLENTPRVDVGYVAENRGSGYRAIVADCANAGLPEPLPRNSIATFSLTLFGANGVRSHAGVETRSIANPYVASGRSRVERRGPYDISTYLGPTDRAVLEAVRKQGSASTRELVQETGKSRPTILKALRRLLDEGLICADGGAKNSPRMRYWPL